MSEIPKAPRVHTHYSHPAAQPDACPTCGMRIELLTNVEDSDAQGPEPGAKTICIECGHTAILDERLRLRKMSTQEFRSACEDRHFLNAYAAGAPMRRRYRTKQNQRED